MGETISTVLASALESAASSVGPQPQDKGFQERRLEEAFVEALRARLPDDIVVNARTSGGIVIPDWDPRPGPVDVWVAEQGSVRAAIELKIDDVEHSIWDILKMASASTMAGVEIACVAVAARRSTWAGGREGVALFEPPTEEWGSGPWSAEFILAEYARSWKKMMAEARGRPRRLPASIALDWVGAFEVPSFPGYELRALAVSAVFDDWIELDENGAVTVNCHRLPNEIDDDDLTLNDVPGPTADELELRRFAVTANGYRRMGTQRRLARLSNEVVTRWQAAGSLPSDIGPLRCAFLSRTAFRTLRRRDPARLHARPRRPDTRTRRRPARTDQRLGAPYRAREARRSLSDGYATVAAAAFLPASAADRLTGPRGLASTFFPGSDCVVTRRDLADFWDAQLERWLDMLPLSSRLHSWRSAYSGVIQEWAFPEPYIGALLGQPRIVMLANNPGIAHEELQSRSGVFASAIRALGVTAWAATRPYEGPESEWVKRFGVIRHNTTRVAFAQRFLDDPSVSPHELLNVELFPWHSPRLERAIRVDPEPLREFILEPLAELASDVPLIALGRAWSHALDQAPRLIESCEHFDRFKVPSRRARLYTTHAGNRILVAWHSGSDAPPAGEDPQRLREIWHGTSTGTTHRATPRRQPSHRLPASEPSPRRARTPGDSLREGRRPRYATLEELAAAVSDPQLRALMTALPEHVRDRFDGAAIPDVRVPGTGQVRLRLLGQPGRIGWDVKRQWLYVWINKPQPGDLATLRASVSTPTSVKLNPSDYISFQLKTERDAQALLAIVESHLHAIRNENDQSR